MSELLPGCLDRGEALAPGKWRCRSTRVVIPGGFVTDADCLRCGFRRLAEPDSGIGSEPANGDLHGAQPTLESRLAVPIPRLSLAEVQSLPRHLIYHLYPIRDSVWKENLDELLRRENVFDGRRILTVALDAETVSETAVREALRGVPADVRFVENVPAMGETVSFERMLAEVLNLPGLTFYAHGKGVSRMHFRDTFGFWARSMYTLLDRLDEVSTQLTGKGVCGFARQFANRTGDGRYGWHYPGSFYWFRNDAVAARPYEPTKRDRFLTERFPADLFRFEESGTLVERPIAGSPYDREVWEPLLTNEIEQHTGRRRIEVVTPPIAVRRNVDIDVIIPCHNYGRYLRECLDSVLHSSVRPASIIVVDDSSTDNTGDIAAEFSEVRYVRVEHRSAIKSRRAGFELGRAAFVLFLDADDVLHPNYIEAGLEQFRRETGVVYSDFTLFGETSGRRVLNYDPSTIQLRNTIHAGAIYRRAALDVSQSLEQKTSESSHDDWHVAKRVVAHGWKVVKNPVDYRYRIHGSSMMKSAVNELRGPEGYYQLANLRSADVTICIPFSGRRFAWPKLRDWLERQTHPRDKCKLLLANCGTDDHFADEVAMWLPTSGYKSFAITRFHVGQRSGLADENRRDERVCADVRIVVARIYSRMRQELTTEFAFIVEDDIVPPLDAIDRLLRCLDHKVVCATGAYRSRYHQGFVLYDANRQPLTRGTGRQEVYFHGFGCLLTRRSVLDLFPITHVGKFADYDLNFCESIREAGWKSVVDWSVECEHQEASEAGAS